MAKIAINLLPVEFTKKQLKDAKFYKLQAFGVGMILVLIFLASLTVALRILQSQRLKQAEARLDNTSQKVISFQDKQVALMALKNRLVAIGKYIGAPSLQAELLDLINTLLPPSVAINALAINRSGEIALSVVFPDSTTLDYVMATLMNKGKNKNKISAVSIESLVRGRDGIYRLNFKVKPK